MNVLMLLIRDIIILSHKGISKLCINILQFYHNMCDIKSPVFKIAAQKIRKDKTPALPQGLGVGKDYFQLGGFGVWFDQEVVFNR